MDEVKNDGVGQECAAATANLGDKKDADRAETQIISDELLLRALDDEGLRERLIYTNESLCNAVIARYLDELSGSASVPVVRGFAALHPLPRPKTLQEAKRIVDNA